MTGTLPDLLTLAAALGCGTVGGVFFAFSTFVMQGLARLRAPQGVAAMQSINVTAVRPAFMTAVFGTAALCAVLAVRGAGMWGEGGSPLLVAGAALYLLGTVGVTVVGNVPLNNALAAAEPDSAAAAALWLRYLRRWTLWNHVRTVSALAAAVVFVLVAGRP